jgi:gluconolactonase
MTGDSNDSRWLDDPHSLVQRGAVVELLFTGAEWAEGPAWLPETASLRFSDIPNDRILEFDSASGSTRVYADKVEYTNGRTLDQAGAVVQCSHGMRRVERDVAGHVTSVVDRWAGGRFNSPNDVVVASDGAVWFTDPPYGLHSSGREGHPGEQDYGGCFVFRYADGAAEPVITDMVHPNGLAFSPDESVLYVVDTGWIWDPTAPRHIRVYDVATMEGRVFVVPDGVADGLRVDDAGRVWTSSSEFVQVFSPEAELLLSIPVPEHVSNLCFGGADASDLYITASTSLYRIRTATRASPRPLSPRPS